MDAETEVMTDDLISKLRTRSSSLDNNDILDNSICRRNESLHTGASHDIIHCDDEEEHDLNSNDGSIASSCIQNSSIRSNRTEFSRESSRDTNLRSTLRHRRPVMDRGQQRHRYLHFDKGVLLKIFIISCACIFIVIQEGNQHSFVKLFSSNSPRDFVSCPMIESMVSDIQRDLRLLQMAEDREKSRLQELELKYSQLEVLIEETVSLLAELDRNYKYNLELNYDLRMALESGAKNVHDENRENNYQGAIQLPEVYAWKPKKKLSNLEL